MKGFVQVYTPRAKEDIRAILLKYLEPAQVEFFTDYILTCLDELIKNGIKANYKYVYLRERIENFLEEHQGQGHPELTEILRNAQVLNDFVDQHIQTDDLVGMVRKVLNDEAKAIRLKTKVSEESRKYTDEERDLIKGLDEVHRIKDLAEKYDVKLQVSVYEDEKVLILDVINSAPILQKDLASIQQKRKTFREHVAEGNQHLFFMHHLDDSGGGAGLGYGTIDACLLEMGLDPDETMKIISLSNTTIVLSIEIAQLQEQLKNLDPEKLKA